MRIVGACSLHRISSSSFRLYSEETHPFQLHNGPHTLKRKPFTRLRPPRDSIDLGDRIRMFWSAFSGLLFVFCYNVRDSSLTLLFFGFVLKCSTGLLPLVLDGLWVYLMRISTLLGLDRWTRTRRSAQEFSTRCSRAFC